MKRYEFTAMLRLFIAGTALFASQALAQTWPAKPVRMLIGVGPGSAPDVVARVLAEHLSVAWGQTVVPENRVGASGNIAAQQAARAPADGYTLWFAQSGPLALNPFVFKTLGFDPDKDFAPVAFVGAATMLLAAHPSLGVGSLQELIALAKLRPGRIAWGASGVNSAPQLIGEALFHAAGVRMYHVPYKTSPQLVQGALAGEVQVVIDGSASLISHNGKLKMLAVSTPNRLPGMADVPAMSEAVPGFSMIGFFAVLAPVGTPAEVVARANHDVNAAVATPAVASRLAQLGIYPHAGVSGGSPEAVERFIRADRALWARVTRELNVQPD